MSTDYIGAELTIDAREDLEKFALLFDHTNLKPTSGRSQIEKLCQEAAEYGFAAVCVAPRWVEIGAGVLSELGATTVHVCTVVGFPHGNTTTDTKVYQTAHAIASGASEIDMVMSIGDLKDGNMPAVHHDIAAVVEEARAAQDIVKVILETAYLDTDEIISACRCAVDAGADYVKTSTGFGPSGADAKIVRLMRDTVGDTVGVKAAGGIGTLEKATRLIEAGASRLGCSSSVAIMEELRKRLEG